MQGEGSAEKFFLDGLDTIERAIRSACNRARMSDDDREEFASWVRLRLIENDYAIVRKHDPQSSFGAYMAVVVHRLLLDYRIAQWGKWHASAEAKRYGEPAITIEAMLYRDGRTIDEVLPALRRRWPDLTREKVEELANTLPARLPRPRAVEVDVATGAIGEDAATVHEAAFASERRALSRIIDETVRGTIRELDPHDRLLFRLRFEGGLSIAQIARTLGVEQKPLYRRLQRTLARLRARLESAGVAAEDAIELLSTRETDFDFGFGTETSESSPSSKDRDEEER